MSAYLIVHGTPQDADKLAQYSQAAAPTLAAFGAELVTKGRPEVLTGETSGLAAVFRFPDKEAAQRWYASEPYQALIALRDQAMRCSFLLC